MRRRQCAARSSVRIAKVRNPFNWSMADAWCSFLSLLTWYLYFPKKWHQCCYSTEFLVGTLVVVGEQKKSWINKNLCRNSTAGFRKWHNKSSPWNFAENEHEFIRNCHKGFNILWLVHENVFHSFHDNWAGVHRLKHEAHSGVRAAEQRNSWVCAKKATRSPQRRTRRIATKFIDPCLPRDAILSLYWFYWLRTLYVIQWQYVTCYTATLTNEISVTARYTSWWNEFRSIMLLLDILLGEINFVV